MPKILVIGRGRCGTKAVATALQKMGLDCQHEAIGVDGSVNHSWAMDVDGRPPLDSYTHVWHVVRDPRRNIASMHTLAWRLKESFSNQKLKPGQLTTLGGGPAPNMPLAQKYWNDLTARCAASYYEWNLLCEDTLQEAAALGAHTWRFRIEDNWIPIAAKLLDREPVEISTRINSRLGHSKHPGVLTWRQLTEGLGINETAGLIEMARRYGYEAPRMRLPNAKEKTDKTPAA